MAFSYGTVTNCKVVNGQTRKEYECRLGYEVQSQSISNNTSSVKLRLQVRSINSTYKTYGYNQTTKIDGTSLAAKSFDMRSTNTWQTFGERTITVAHNANGSYSASKSGSFTTTTSSSNGGAYALKSGSASVTVAPATIPRYATSVQSLKSKTSSSITMNWSSDSTIDYIWYSKDNGTTWVAVGSVSATSGSYTISGLSSNTTYNIKTRVRRKDSQLTTDSATLAVATHYKTTASISVSSKTETSITVSSSANVTASSTRYRIKTSSGSYGSWQTSATFTGLSPNTSYYIQVEKTGQASGEAGYATTALTTTYNYPYCTSSPDFYIGNNVTFTFYNPLSRTISVNILNASGTRIVTGYSTSSTTLTSTATEQVKNALYRSIPNAKNGKYQVEVIYGSVTKIRNNGNKYYTRGTEKPIFTDFDYADTYDKTLALTGNSQILVNGYSKLKVTIPTSKKATAQNSSSILKYRLNVGSMSSVEATYKSDAEVSMSINAVNSPSITVTAIDSREYPTAVIETATFKAYKKPVITSLTAVRGNGGVGSQVSLSFKGTWWGDNFGKVQNAIKEIIYYYKKTTDSTWTQGNTVITANSNKTEFYGTIDIEGPNEDDKGFDVSTAYNIKMTVKDELDISAAYQVVLGTGTPALAIYDNKVAIGQKYDEATDEVLQVGGKMKVSGSAQISDFGNVQSYSASLNDINVTKIVYADSASTNKPVNSNGYCITMCVSTDYRKQIYYVQSSNLVYERIYYKGWGVWEVNPLIQFLGTGNDLNNVIQVGQYGIYGTNTNGPTTSIAVLEVIKYSPDWILQRVTTVSAEPKIYVRCYHSGSTWGAWFQTVNAGVPVSGTFNKGSWNTPTKGLITQVTDNSQGQHSVMVGLKSDGKTRLYGIDLYDSDTSPNMRIYTGSSYLHMTPTYFYHSSGKYYESLTVGGTLKAEGSVNASNGLLYTTYNGNTVTIGSQNSSYCHIYNSANIPFYFNKDIYVNGYRCLTSSDLTAGVSSIKVGDYYVTKSGIAAITSSTDGNTYFGSGGSYSGKITNIRGNTVRLYAHTSGAVYLGYSGSTAVTSDENLKDIYEIDDKYIEFFNNLKPITYIYKNKGHRNHMGFGARQVEDALIKSGLSTEEFAGVLKDNNVTISADEMGTEEDVHFDELYSLRYEEFIALNTYMIQKQAKQIEEQNKIIEELKNRIDILENN